MAFSEFETKRCDKAMAAFLEKRRPPPRVRAELDLGYRIEGQSVEIFEIRPYWRDPAEIMEHAVAKATYVKTQQIWKIFWQRADLKWHGYEPHPKVKTIEKFLEIVDRDEHACFFG